MNNVHQLVQQRSAPTTGLSPLSAIPDHTFLLYFLAFCASLLVHAGAGYVLNLWN